MARSEELLKKSKRIMLGGVNSPVRAFHPYPFFTDHTKLLAKGFFIPPSQFEACFLSSAHSTEDIDKLIACAVNALKK